MIKKIVTYLIHIHGVGGRERLTVSRIGWVAGGGGSMKQNLLEGEGRKVVSYSRVIS